MSIFRDGVIAGKVHKFGRNSVVSTGTVPEDIWDGGGEYAWPTSATVTTIVSNSASDDSTQTGAKTVQVQGLDADYLLQSETVNMSGLTTGTLSNNYLRVFRAKVTGAGASGLNVGQIDIKHGATVVARISSGMGQTLMALYTIPDDYETGYMTKWYCSMSKKTSTGADIVLQARPESQGWQTKEFVGLQTTANSTYAYEFGFPRMQGVKPGLEYAAKTDLRVRVQDVTADNTDVAAGFDIILDG